MKSATAKKILVIDDDPDIVALLKHLLGGKGYKVVGSYEPAKVPELIEQVKPSAVILDIGLGGFDGRDICKYIKSRHENISVILMSAYFDISHSANAAGADAFIAKPFEIVDVIKVVSSLI